MITIKSSDIEWNGNDGCIRDPDRVRKIMNENAEISGEFVVPYVYSVLSTETGKKVDFIFHKMDNLKLIDRTYEVHISRCRKHYVTIFFT